MNNKDGKDHDDDDNDDDDDDNNNGDDMKGEVEYKDTPPPSCCSVKDKIVHSHKAEQCTKALKISIAADFFCISETEHVILTGTFNSPFPLIWTTSLPASQEHVLSSSSAVAHQLGKMMLFADCTESSGHMQSFEVFHKMREGVRHPFGDGTFKHHDVVPVAPAGKPNTPQEVIKEVNKSMCYVKQGLLDFSAALENTLLFTKSSFCKFNKQVIIIPIGKNYINNGYPFAFDKFRENDPIFILS
ncbi:hypothetical protein STEG23_006227, partial [Scotinomys teguina]